MKYSVRVDGDRVIVLGEAAVVSRRTLIEEAKKAGIPVTLNAIVFRESASGGWESWIDLGDGPGATPRYYGDGLALDIYPEDAKWFVASVIQGHKKKHTDS